MSHVRAIQSRLVGSLASPSVPSSAKPSPAKFYHIFLDLRAFVGSFCAPGESAELFFSIYKHSDNPRFVTEECCVVLNHNGVMTREGGSTMRARALFTDIAHSDAQDALFLVCRVVRNGAMKMASSIGSGVVRSSTSPHSSGFVETPNYRRPFGCAVLELSELSKMVAEGLDVSPTREYTMPIYVPVNEALFSMLHQDIIAGNSREFEKSSRAEMLAVSVKIFHGDVSTIIKENMSFLQDIPLTLRLGFPDVVFPGDVRNELYIKLWSGEFPTLHAQSARLSMVNFARPGPAAQNVQVTVEVRDASGNMVENAISLGSGEPPVTQFHSLVFARNSQPTYGELIKLQLPLRGVPDWHLFFTFRNRTGNRALGPERVFAFAFQPLFPGQGAFLEDGSHTLVLYKADRLGQITPDMYLSSSPWVLPGQRPDQLTVSADLLRLAPPLRDTLIIRSSLCSTKFTQNPVLLSLLKWDQIPDKELLSTVLTKFTFVGEGEIVKFLSDIFDSLFGILVSQMNQSGEMDHLVFNALVTVLGIIQDRRFSNFQPVLDIYIEQHFNCASASSRMIKSMDRLLRNPTGTDTASPLRAALKVWHYVFKFITRARELQKSSELGMSGGATAEHLEATFKKEVRTHLMEVNRMMATSAPPSIIGTQTIALQHFTSILPELSKVFSTIELVTATTNFANAISNAKGKIVIWRLIMYLQIAVVLWIKPYFGRYDEFTQTQQGDSDSVKDASRVCWLESVRLCVTILAVMLDKLQQQLVSSTVLSDRTLIRQEQDNVEYLLMLLPRLLDSYRGFQNPANLRAIERTRTPATSPSSVPVTFPESYPFSLMASPPNAPRIVTRETAIVFLALILSAPTKHIYNFLESSYDIEGKDNFAALLMQFFNVATSILDNDAWPSTWLNVNILAHKVLIKMMDPVATLLKGIFVPPPSAAQQFKSDLWRDAFQMLFKLLSSDQLVIEDFTAQKRRAVWRLGGDIRGEGADILLRLWNCLKWPETPDADTSQGGYQPVLSPLIGQIVNLCLSHHDSLRNNAVGILFGMIISEHRQTGHFEQIENELVKKLDSLFMSQSKGDDISRAFFIAHLRQLFESTQVDNALRERVSTFLDCVDAFLKLLLSLRNLPEGEEYGDDRVIAMLRLMNFIREIGRDEMYIKYVHQLVNAHLQSQNYVEAALTLKLHSDLHDWDLYSFVPPMEDLGLPQQSQFHRKETLCLLILDYLGKGKAYESAIDICKELAKQHAEVTFNYTRLAEILRHQATLLELIINDQRYYPDYFRVAFFGEFPDALRSKQFIYRGYEWEKIPVAEDTWRPACGYSVRQRSTHQITAVSPEPNRTLPIFTCPDVPPTIRNYYEHRQVISRSIGVLFLRYRHSSVNVFSNTRPITKTDRDGNEEMWLEKTSYTTEQAFPTVLGRSDITEWEVVEISPVDHAYNEVEQKTRELDFLHLRYSALAKTAQIFSTNALSMTLNAAVDPPMDGIPGYREAYFNSTYITQHADREEQVDRLRTAIDDHVRVIDSCLKLHVQICPPEMLRFHQTLEDLFRKNFPEEIGRISAQGGFDDASSHAYARVNDQSSLQENASLQRSLSTNGQTNPLAFALSTAVPPQPMSPLVSSHGNGADVLLPPKRTPLQLHAAHVARHGINGVSSGWRQDTMSNSETGGSPRNSMITVGNSPSVIGPSGASIVGSLKGRFSRLGSLRSGRRG
ncbi:putative cytoplasmic protein [Boletus reticuloceps]|uniref:Putative cytoplasmic protein n=1 Tax=Boletus reticuloceps TaxID=495285 RepID=A0A8I3AC55_9AGAM|nr:putative cytoplasmic protein [Boletus reticuloceps]